ncbi:MAG TPA: BON domain-containing protein [Pyrinomonadaceae bacterium]|jgi:osmotically-inducible protein OsmY|nr:BON domain-containing protein [Pyrinomonadaceae bacterium]
MKLTNILRSGITVSALLLVSGIAAQAQKTDCSTMTDDQMSDAVYARVNTKYSAELKHVNVSVISGVATIRGWTSTKKVKSEIEKAAKKIKCLKQIDSHITVGASGGCSPGMKTCGDLCIGGGDRCVLKP